MELGQALPPAGGLAWHAGGTAGGPSHARTGLRPALQLERLATDVLLRRCYHHPHVLQHSCGYKLAS
jgi:hypothetical protein